MKINRGFPFTPAHLCRLHAQFVLILETTRCSAAHLQTQAFCSGQTFSRAFLVSFIGTHLPSPLTNAIDVEETYKNGTQESGAVRLQ